MSTQSAEAFYEFLRTQRAVRRLRPDPIPDEVLARILDATRHAPSGGNRQGWRMVLVTDPAKKARLGELYTPMWEAYCKQYANTDGMSPDAAASLKRTLDSGSYMAAHMGEYPPTTETLSWPASVTARCLGLKHTTAISGYSPICAAM